MEQSQFTPQPRCTACDTDRRLVHGERVSATYEMRSYRCPVCGTEVRMVGLSERLPESHSARSFH